MDAPLHVQPTICAFSCMNNQVEEFSKRDNELSITIQQKLHTRLVTFMILSMIMHCCSKSSFFELESPGCPFFNLSSFCFICRIFYKIDIIETQLVLERTTRESLADFGEQ